MKYIISYETEFGHISAESDDPDELIPAYSKLEKVAEQLSTKKIIKKKITRSYPRESSSKVPETSIILRDLESNMLSSKFFGEPRTTGETRERLLELSGRSFASRKVSQALGILKDRGKLKRKGKRNFYQYSLS